MRKKSFILILVVLMLSMFLAVACSSGTDNGDDAESETQVEESEPLSAEELGISENIPLPPSYYDFQATQDGTNISFSVDGDVENIVNFYQAELPNYGWEETRSPDNVLGAMATVIRENEAGERITFQIQYNPVGDFVVVRIVIVFQQTQ
jgi:hypothetical protein